MSLKKYLAEVGLAEVLTFVSLFCDKYNIMPFTEAEKIWDELGLNLRTLYLSISYSIAMSVFHSKLLPVFTARGTTPDSKRLISDSMF